jgi:hypothetical protein
MKKIYLAVLFFAIISTAPAQFTEISSQFGILLTGNTVQSGCGASMYDYDYDGWDDLTLGQPFNPILVYHNNQGNYEIAAVFDNNGDPKQLTWVDIENDGDADFFFSVRGQGCKLYRNDGNMQFTNITANLNQPISTGMSFGCAWGDYDNDSFLDVYICNYSQGPAGHSNWLLHNNGDGTFTNVTTEMGVGNGNKPTYQAAWIDINLDGLLDLYVVNDFDWLNELYINNGTTFDAAGDAWNFDLAMEGMSISFTDLESDGDFDAFISNNVQGNALMINDNNVMTDIAATAGVSVNSTCWGSLWMDYDHDGLDDLHVATSLLSVNGNQNYLFHNNGDYTFSDESLAGDALIVFATVKGDQNNDGWWDFVEMRQYPAALALWQNNGGTNNWMKFRLQGTASNREGVGSLIRYYYPGKAGMLQTHSGEGYLAQDSQWEIISMAEHTTLDSLTVTWPSGWVDRYYGLNAQSVYTFIEGETFMPYITAPGGQLLCANSGSLELIASPGASFQWSDESLTQHIVVSEPGLYSVTVTNDFGINGIAEIEIGVREDITIQTLTDLPTCYGVSDGCISFTSPDGVITDVSWSEDRGDVPCDFAAGEYTAFITDEFGCVQSVSVELQQPDSLVLNVSADTACYDSMTSMSVEGFGGTGNLQFTYVNGFDPGAVLAGTYEVILADENNCSTSVEIEVSEYPQILFVLDDMTVCPDATGVLAYNASGGVGNFVFDWNELDPNALPAGEYEFSVLDDASCEAAATVTVSEFSEMQVTAQIQDAQNGSNGSILLTVNGGTQPYSFDWDNGETGNPLIGIGQGSYVVSITDANDCVVSSEFSVIDLRVSEHSSAISIYPNPCDAWMRLEGLTNEDVRIFDGTGKLLLELYNAPSALSIETSNFPNGLYFLMSGTHTEKFMVRH